jgi:hypothetical protein
VERHHHRGRELQAEYAGWLDASPDNPENQVGGATIPWCAGMLTILAGVATWKREIMLERQREASPRRRPPANTRAARSASMRRRLGS